MRFRLIHILLIIILSLIPACVGESTAGEDYHPGIGVPVLSLAASQSDMFGTTYIGASNDVTITITNSGSEKAGNISGMSLSSPFTYKGGSFPGTGGTCETVLNVGVSCNIVVTYTPTATGTSTETLTLTYYNYYGGAAKTATISLSGTSSSGSAGSLDTQTFGTSGKVTTTIGSGRDVAQGVATQSDGKIVVGGYYYNGSKYKFALARYLTNGSLDTTFDSDGKVTTAISANDDYGMAVAVQSDGKILLAGYSSNGTDYDFALARYNTDGSLDTTFSSDGMVTTAVGGGNDVAYAMTLQSDGKILLAGYSSNGANNDFALVRYNTDGTLDATFDSDGMVTTAIGAGNDTATSLALQSDGKIVVAGYSYSAITLEDIAIVRYNTDGSLDTTFDTDGKVTTDYGSSDSDYVYGVAIQSDGKIVVVGNYDGGASNGMLFAQYNTNGSLVTKTYYEIGTSTNVARSVSIQSDGKMIVAGYYQSATDIEIGILRLTSSGSLDTTFDGDGKFTPTLGSHAAFGIGRSTGYATAIQSDGKALIAGYSYNGSNYDFSLIRVWP